MLSGCTCLSSLLLETDDVFGIVCRPQTTIGTAMVLCHRFFVRKSHACHDRFVSIWIYNHRSWYADCRVCLSFFFFFHKYVILSKDSNFTWYYILFKVDTVFMKDILQKYCNDFWYSICTQFFFLFFISVTCKNSWSAVHSQLGLFCSLYLLLLFSLLQRVKRQHAHWTTYWELQWKFFITRTLIYSCTVFQLWVSKVPLKLCATYFHFLGWTWGTCCLEAFFMEKSTQELSLLTDYYVPTCQVLFLWNLFELSCSYIISASFYSF